MKNTKAIFLIILGAFLMATGFAFAEPALDQLRNGPFGGSAAADLTPVTLPAGELNKALPTETRAAKPEVKAVPTPESGPVLGLNAGSMAAEAAKAEAKAKADAPKPPTLTQKIQKFIGDNRSVIWGTLIFAFLGAALFANPLAGALVGFALFKFF